MNYHVMMLPASPPYPDLDQQFFRLNFFLLKFSLLNDDDNLKPSNKHKFLPSTFITIASHTHIHLILLAVSRRQMKTFFKDRSMKNAKHMFVLAYENQFHLYGQMEFLWRHEDNKNFFIPYP